MDAAQRRRGDEGPSAIDGMMEQSELADYHDGKPVAWLIAGTYGGPAGLSLLEMLWFAGRPRRPPLAGHAV
jgi:hypothetical protein